MNEQELQLQIILLVQAAMLGNQQATLQIQQIMQAAQLGDQLAVLLALMIQAVAQQMLGGSPELVQAAKFGAKLNYIKQLRGQCPEGTELKYFKTGGRLCKKCMQILNQMPEVPQDPIEAFKCGGKKVKKGQKGLETNTPTKTNRTPFTVHDGKGGKKTTYVKDEATRDSLYVNRYNDLELQVSNKGSYKGGKWTPDRKNVYTNHGNIPRKK